MASFLWLRRQGCGSVQAGERINAGSGNGQWAMMIALIRVTAGIYPGLLVGGAVMLSPAVRPFQGFAEPVGKCCADLAAVPVVMEGRLGLLEIDIAPGLLGVEDIADTHLDATFLFQDLFSDGCGGLSHGPDNDLSFHAPGTIKSGDLTTPSMAERELVVQVHHQRGRLYIDGFAIEHPAEFIVVDVGIEHGGPSFHNRDLGADGQAGVLPAADISPADNGCAA